VQDTMRTINDACRSRGGAHAQYSCKTVSWDDAQRGTVGGGLSCWGSNITDTRLYERSGRALFTVRPDNWNEKLGKVSTADVALLVGNEGRGGGDLRPMTVRQYLKGIGQHGSYAGMKPGTSLHDEALDRAVSIRFQTTFLPVDADGSERETLEFAPEAYNYCTRDDKDPRNLVLLCTTQGTAVQQDGQGAKKLFHHAVDESGKVHRYWLEAEASKHKVGGAQAESQEEKEDALSRGKATASVIGVKAMGTRFNVLMTIQVPLKQTPQPKRRAKLGSSGSSVKSLSSNCFGGGKKKEKAKEKKAKKVSTWVSSCSESGESDECEVSYCFGGSMSWADCVELKSHSCALGGVSSGGLSRRRRMDRTRPAPRPKVGRASAARVSRGSEQDVWQGLTVQQPQRNEAEHVTVTVVLYNTVAGGVPSEEDVAAAIDDMEELYRSCAWSGRLADEGADFIKAELTVADTIQIGNKISTQPYTPSSHGVVGGDSFPVDEEEEVLEEHSNIICDVCDPEHRISGPRYHKRGLDYDLCEAQFRKLSTKEQTQFEMISKPGVTPIDVSHVA